MSNIDTIRAWTDTDYRDSLTEAQKQLLPEHPAGLSEVSEGSLDEAGGGAWGVSILFSVICFGGG